MFKLGRMATGSAATALNQGARQLGRGEAPTTAGIFLLCSRIKARVDVHGLVRAHLRQAANGDPLLD